MNEYSHFEQRIIRWMARHPGYMSSYRIGVGIHASDATVRKYCERLIQKNFLEKTVKPREIESTNNGPTHYRMRPEVIG